MNRLEAILAHLARSPEEQADFWAESQRHAYDAVVDSRELRHRCLRTTKSPLTSCHWHEPSKT